MLSHSAFPQSEEELGKFVIHGQILGKDSGTIYFSCWGNGSEQVNDTVPIIHGRFEISGNIDGPETASIKDTRMRGSTTNLGSTIIFIEPTDMFFVAKANDFPAAKLMGSRMQDDYTFFLTCLAESKRRAQPLLDSLSTLKELRKQNDNPALRAKDDSFYVLLQKYYEEQRKIAIYFIENHPKSHLSAYLLRNYFSQLPVDSAKSLFKKLTMEVQNGPFGRRVFMQIHSSDEVQNNALAPDFATTDVNGAPLRLSQFRNKNVVLLDFWASWCIPCRATHPGLRKLYEEFRSKGLVIIGVSLDEDGRAWRKAIKADSIGWYHILLSKNPTIPENVTSLNDLRSNYDIPGIPNEILIGRDGRVIAKTYGDAGESEEDVWNTVAKLMN